jgi:hypothetical protein
MHFSFKGLNGTDSKCDVAIYQDVATKRITVVVTELTDDNPGTSVTNAWPKLADDICHHFIFSKGLRGEIVWIEHYPERGQGGRFPESWDLVRMSHFQGLHWTMNTAEHPWRHLNEKQVQDLIRGETIS